jgi:hypothetical protein
MIGRLVVIVSLRWRQVARSSWRTSTSSAWAAPRGPQLPVYSAQAELVAESLAVKAQDPGLHLSAHLAARQEPDDRASTSCDPIWLKQMERTRKEVARLRRRRKPAAAPAIAPSLVDA